MRPIGSELDEIADEYRLLGVKPPLVRYESDIDHAVEEGRRLARP